MLPTTAISPKHGFVGFCGTAQFFNEKAKFSGFVLRDAVMFRDGGTIKAKGLFNRSSSANIRLDGALNSPTRGTFFVTLKSFRPGPSDAPGQSTLVAERPMTRAELEGLSDSLLGQLNQLSGNNQHLAKQLLVAINEQL